MGNQLMKSLIIAALLGTLSYTEVVQAVQLQNMSNMDASLEVTKHHKKHHKHKKGKKAQGLTMTKAEPETGPEVKSTEDKKNDEAVEEENKKEAAEADGKSKVKEPLPASPSEKKAAAKK